MGKKPLILVSGNLPASVLEYLRKDFLLEYHSEDRPMPRPRLLGSLGDKYGLLAMITDSVDEELFAHAPQLRMVANMAVGYNNIDVAAATSRGILVSNTPGVLTDATADLAFSLILATARRVVEGDRIVRQGEFRFWAPFNFLGRDVSGKTLGIVGMGRIGQAVARRAAGFGMPVIYYSRKPLKKSLEKALHANFVPFADLLKDADFITLHVPLAPDTQYLIGKKEFSLMKRTAMLINTSRGPVVDEKALLSALKKGLIAGAGIDVYENEPEITSGLEKINQAVLLPHVGSATLETRTRMAQMAANNLRAGLLGQMPPNLINPEVMKTKQRLS